ncbi:MAG: DUF116 domain-containing protein [Elusimicrobia bacterium]|nr:DUF116 domain-containing protein [Elusimicrobiota bacterium]
MKISERPGGVCYQVLVTDSVMVIAGICGIIFSSNIIIRSASLVLAALGTLGLAAALGAEKLIPVPGLVKRWMLFNIDLSLNMLVSGILGTDRDRLYRNYIYANNRMNRKVSGRVMVLLPKCIQNSECTKNLEADVNNCAGCGKCQVCDVIRIAGRAGYPVELVRGGRLAVEKVKKMNPDSIIAVACEYELAEGIKAVVRKPVMAVKNTRPSGPCINTRIDISDLEDLIGSPGPEEEKNAQ